MGYLTLLGPVFLAMTACFSFLVIRLAILRGRHTGYFRVDISSPDRPHFLPVRRSIQSSLNHLVSPPECLAISTPFLVSKICESEQEQPVTERNNH